MLAYGVFITSNVSIYQYYTLELKTKVTILTHIYSLKSELLFYILTESVYVCCNDSILPIAANVSDQCYIGLD